MKKTSLETLVRRWIKAEGVAHESRMLAEKVRVLRRLKIPFNRDTPTEPDAG